MSSPFPVPLNAMRAIEIVARRGALAPAAEELGVTIGAVSQHIRRAEARLGVELFTRTPQGLVPTPALTRVAPRLSAGFRELGEAVASLRPDTGNVLTVTTGSVFASRWLVWRLPKFTALHPDTEIRLVITPRNVDLAYSDIDCGIRFGLGQWPGLRAEPLGGRRFRPVCAPSLAARLATPADIARVPLIHDTTTMLSWEAWCAAAGVPAPADARGPTFNDPALAFDAAIAGQGLLMAVDEMAADAVGDGRLVHPFDIAAETGVAYWVVTSAERALPRRTRAFRDWIIAEMAAQATAAQGTGLARQRTPGDAASTLR